MTARLPRLLAAFRPSLAVAAILAAALACAQEPPRSDLDEVVQRLQEDFIDRGKVSDEAMELAAINGILDHLGDPYTAYLPPERYEAFTLALQGQREDFEGIGASVTESNGRVVILGPLPGSPALDAGLMAGDVVLRVNGESIERLTLQETVSLIRGPKGTQVVLTVSRPGAPLPMDIAIVRGVIAANSVQSRLQADGVGYVRIASFDAPTPEDLRATVAGLREHGARGLVLDLRGNGGGLVNAAVGVVSEFVREGEVIRWVDADGSETVESVTGGGTAYDLPLAVIVDGYSASASEVVAGALQDHERAVIVGARTFGKGSVNVLHELESGAGLHVTIARWHTPNGRMIEGEGITPDARVGDQVDVQALGRIGELAAELCAVYARDEAAPGLPGSFTGALDDLCGAHQSSGEAVEADEPLEAAAAAVRGMIGR